MEPSEENPPPADEPAPAEPSGDAPAEAESGAEQPETQEVVGDSTTETHDDEKPEGEAAPEQPDTQAASDAVPDHPEGEPVPEPPADESGKPEGEPTSEHVAVEEGAGEPTSETHQESVPETPKDHPHVDDVPGQTDLEFIGTLVNEMVCEVVGEDSQDAELDFLCVKKIVNKIVSHAIGEESSEESELTLPCEKFVEEIEQEGEDVTEALKYLLGPESMRYEVEPWRPEIPFTCLNFMNVIEYARAFVDGILEKAQEVCLLKYGVPVKYYKKQFGVQNIRWPSIDSFTIELGTKKIDEYIQMTFEVEENWLYKINFIAAQSDLSSDIYLYEAIFCIPTPCYPIAQATVSVYFSLDVSRVKPRECPIDVTYTIESLKEVLVPGKTVVNDDMLLRLVYSKLSVFKSLYF